MAMEGQVQLQSSDGVLFEVDQSVAFVSGKIRQMILDAGMESVISLPVHSEILEKILKYCAYHVEAATNHFIPKENVKKWDEEFVEVDVYTRIILCNAADILKINNLSELMCSTIAGMIKGKTEEELRATFHWMADYIPGRLKSPNNQNFFL